MLKVYELLKKVPKGRVTTYGELAKACNTSPRHVGYLMSVNPFAPEVPCHRVVRSNGCVGGFNGSYESDGKVKLLEGEGVKVINNNIVNFKELLFNF